MFIRYEVQASFPNCGFQREGLYIYFLIFVMVTFTFLKKPPSDFEQADLVMEEELPESIRVRGVLIRCEVRDA